MFKLFVFAFLLIQISADELIKKENGKCEEITVPMCRNMEYNMTSMPNQFNHETQAEAAMEAHQFWALVEINCAKELRFFLCSLYTPICLPNYQQPIKACKSVCLRARFGCEKYMKKYGFEWPEHMNCDLFPEYGSTKEVCMDPMDQEQEKQKMLLMNQLNAKSEITNKKKIISSLTKSNAIVSNDESNQSQFLSNVCQHPFLKLTKGTDPRLNKLSTGGLLNCVQPCKSVYFNSWQQMFSSYWLFIWTIICLISSLTTTCTYLIDSSRFKYPEKPIIYLSICYLFVSLGYLLRFIVGHEKMACEQDGSIKYQVSLSNNNMNTLTCHLTFILIYYFGMASSVWWVIISMTWFLAAGLKWGTESIAKYSTYFHLVAWLLPFFKTIAILIWSLVDADPLSGICYVGNLNTQNLRLFVLTPAITYLSIGITFLIAGFISLFRIRNMIKQQHGDLNKAQKIEKLMLRIGIFSILYTVPATCVIACQFYEQHYRQDWERNQLCKQVKYTNDKSIQLYCSASNIIKSEFSESPEFSVFILKYLMSLIVGITSGFWILSKKTLKSWCSFFKRIFCCTNSTNTLKSLEFENGSDNQSTSSGSLFCFLFNCKRSKSNINRKDSIVYFQANDDLENNPHNILYDSASSSTHQQQQHLLPSKTQIYQSESIRIKPQTTFTASVPESYMPLSLNNQYIAYNIQNTNCHTNKAAAFYYDYSNLNNSNNKNETGSSKYSFQSSTLSSALP